MLPVPRPVKRLTDILHELPPPMSIDIAEVVAAFAGLVADEPGPGVVDVPMSMSILVYFSFHEMCFFEISPVDGDSSESCIMEFK